MRCDEMRMDENNKEVGSDKGLKQEEETESKEACVYAVCCTLFSHTLPINVQFHNRDAR